MNTVAEVLRPEFARSWHEAVAIVQAAAAQLVPGVNLPGPSDLYIDDTGALTFGFGSESSSEPVTALASLLEELLEGVDAPASLRELAVENAQSASHATVGSFSQALAFFERPNRASDLRAIASRLSGFRPGSTSSLDQEIARLREKVGAAELPEEKSKHARRQPRLTKRQQAAAVALLAVVMFGSLAVNSGGFSSAVDTAEGGIQRVVSTALNQLGFSKAPSEAGSAASDPAAAGGVEKDSARPNASKPATAATDRSARTAPTAGKAAPGEPRIQPRALDARVTPLPPVANATASHGSPALAERAPGASPPVLPPDPGAPAGALAPTPAPSPAIYSNENHEVQAPVLVRPQMPREPAPASDTGYFELVVDENGDVSQVKLISPRRKYYDRMLVSAAKAWKFRPAMLNGRPVKYRVHMPIIMAGMPGR